MLSKKQNGKIKTKMPKTNKLLILVKKIGKINNMEIVSVSVNNFRNYAKQTAYFSPRINIVKGQNAQGKTNLVEAIYFCSIGKSPRLSNEKELISYNKDFANLTCNFKTRQGTKKIEITINKKGKKVVKINGINILKIADLVGYLKCVFFSPDELKLIKEAPEDRRKFLNTDISQLSKMYFYNLIKYNKILNQRNNLLKSSKDENVVKQTLNIWNEQLATVGAYIVRERLKYVEQIRLNINDIHSKLTDNKEKLEIVYAEYNQESLEEIKQQLLKQLQDSFEKDFRFGYTNVGPHRDDIKFLVNGQDVKNYGSQGQQRSVALSIKLCEVEIFKQVMGEYPILLLDDVLSELDASRKANLLKIISKYQTIITTTEFDEDLEANQIIVKNGIIEKP